MASLDFCVVLPTVERRQALAAALWRTAQWIAARFPGERHLYMTYLRRVQVLGEGSALFDFDAYDRAAGTRHAFFRDWGTHASAAMRFLRYQQAQGAS